MALDPLHKERQLKAIEIGLATAPKIQEDLKLIFGSYFFYNDLVEYRMNNSRKDIAEDLDVKSRYGLTTNEVAIKSVGRAFRGYNGEHFPDHQFDGLLGKVTNDYIQGIRHEKGGLKGYAKGLANLTSEERAEHSRKGALAQGFHLWSLEEVVDIDNFREESFNHSSNFRPNSPSWDYVTAEMNEKYDEDWTTVQVKNAYKNNKHLFSDEEE